MRKIKTAVFIDNCSVDTPGIQIQELFGILSQRLFFDGLPEPRHQGLVEMQVVNGCQVRAQHFLTAVKMLQIGT